MDAAAIQLNFGFTGTTGTHPGTGTADLPTGLATHRIAPTAKTRQEIFKLSELYLSLTFTTLRMLAKNIEYHRGTINNLDLDNILKGAALARGQLGVGNNRIGSSSEHQLTQLLS